MGPPEHPVPDPTVRAPVGSGSGREALLPLALRGRDRRPDGHYRRGHLGWTIGEAISAGPSARPSRLGRRWASCMTPRGTWRRVGRRAGWPAGSRQHTASTAARTRRHTASTSPPSSPRSAPAHDRPGVARRARSRLRGRAGATVRRGCDTVRSPSARLGPAPGPGCPEGGSPATPRGSGRWIPVRPRRGRLVLSPRLRPSTVAGRRGRGPGRSGGRDGSPRRALRRRSGEPGGAEPARRARRARTPASIA